MPFVTLVETTDNNRGRFVSPTFDEAVEELRRHYAIGATVEDRLRKGERIVTDSHTLAIVPLATQPQKKQRLLF